MIFVNILLLRFVAVYSSPSIVLLLLIINYIHIIINILIVFIVFVIIRCRIPPQYRPKCTLLLFGDF